MGDCGQDIEIYWLGGLDEWLSAMGDDSSGDFHTNRLV